MGMQLQIVPWGRSLEEYRQMFALTDNDLKRKILDCGSGPASFNAEMTQRGYNVTSCDPIYQFSADEIQQRIDETYPVILSGVEANRDQFVWNILRSPQNLGQIRMAAMRQFLEDFPQGLQQSRYQQQSLPHLQFATKQFELALCSHLLFTYSEQLSLEFHVASIVEMCRVATEVRIFPLLVSMTGETSPFLDPVLQQLTDDYVVEIKQVSYEFQKGGNQLLQVIAKDR